MTAFDEMSRTIGSIEGKLELHMRESSERFDGISQQLQHIKETISTIPPSPQCLEAHHEFRADITSIKINNAKQAGIMGLLGAAGLWAIGWGAQFIDIKWGK